MTDINLLYEQDEEDLRDSVRALLDERCPAATSIRIYDDVPATPELWNGLAVELGLAELVVPERFGGAGAGPRYAALVCEEIGRAIAPVPFLTSSVIAMSVLVAAAEAGRPVPDFAAFTSGERLAVLAVPASTGHVGMLPQLVVDDGRISGRIDNVMGTVGAGLLLVPVPVAAGVDIYAVAAEAVTIDDVISFDMTRPVADISLAAIPAELVLAAEPGRAAVERALLWGTAMVAAEQVGIARWCLEATVDYVKIRRQFGRTLGSYQALKHRLAELYVSVESATATARYAVGTLAAGDPDAAVAVSVAKDYCDRTAVLAAEEGVQLHGGIGMTWEHPLHLYLKRAKANALSLGDASQQRLRLTELVHLPGPLPEQRP